MAKPSMQPGAPALPAQCCCHTQQLAVELTWSLAMNVVRALVALLQCHCAWDAERINSEKLWYSDAPMVQRLACGSFNKLTIQDQNLVGVHLFFCCFLFCLHNRKMSSRFLWRIQEDTKSVKCAHNERAVQVTELRSLAAQYGVQGRRTLNKVALATALQRHFAALRIWIAWRAHQPQLLSESVDVPEELNDQVASAPLEQPRHSIVNQGSPSSESASLDPITLEPPESPCFIYDRGGGKRTRYTARVFLEYLLSANTFREPVSNLELTDDHLTQLDGIARSMGWPYESVLARRHSAVPERQRQEREVYTIIELELLELAGRIRDSLGNSEVSVHEVARQLRFHLMPELAALYTELRFRSLEASQNSLMLVINLLRAEPPYHLLLAHTVIAHLYALLA
jgi:hypothetical protein